MVLVTYNHRNGCKCHNWACSREGNSLVCLNLSQSSWGDVLDTASYLRSPSFPYDFYPLSLSGCSLSAICAAVSGMTVCLSWGSRGMKTAASDNIKLFSHASSDNSTASPSGLLHIIGKPWHNSDKSVLPKRLMFVNHSSPFSSGTAISYVDSLM